MKAALSDTCYVNIYADPQNFGSVTSPSVIRDKVHYAS